MKVISGTSRVLFIALLAFATISSPITSQAGAVRHDMRLKGTKVCHSAIQPGVLQKGNASWYGPGLHGQRTYSGETFDKAAFTAAHNSYPMNTWVKVTNIRNGKSVVARINDRGPFADGRVIDLSEGAASAIGVKSAGVGKVNIEVVCSPGSIRPMIVPRPKPQIG